ncbi:hypothetical protein HK101_007822 [Irineochytrium annulatum]|nr:hypothetical protein HK101_007822 [Irineochytrium annulatum]
MDRKADNGLLQMRVEDWEGLIYCLSRMLPGAWGPAACVGRVCEAMVRCEREVADGALEGLLHVSVNRFSFYIRVDMFLASMLMQIRLFRDRIPIARVWQLALELWPQRLGRTITLGARSYAAFLDAAIHRTPADETDWDGARECERVYAEMARAGHAIDAATCELFMSIMCRARYAAGCLALWRRVRDLPDGLEEGLGLVMTRRAVMALVAGVCRSGDGVTAEGIVRELIRRGLGERVGVEVMNSILRCRSLAGGRVGVVFAAMRRMGLKPDTATLSIIVSEAIMRRKGEGVVAKASLARAGLAKARRLGIRCLMLMKGMEKESDIISWAAREELVEDVRRLTEGKGNPVQLELARLLLARLLEEEREPAVEKPKGAGRTVWQAAYRNMFLLTARAVDARTATELLDLMKRTVHPDPGLLLELTERGGPDSTSGITKALDTRDIKPDRFHYYAVMDSRLRRGDAEGAIGAIRAIIAAQADEATLAVQDPVLLQDIWDRRDGTGMFVDARAASRLISGVRRLRGAGAARAVVDELWPHLSLVVRSDPRVASALISVSSMGKGALTRSSVPGPSGELLSRASVRSGWGGANSIPTAKDVGPLERLDAFLATGQRPSNMIATAAIAATVREIASMKPPPAGPLAMRENGQAVGTEVTEKMTVLMELLKRHGIDDRDPIVAAALADAASVSGDLATLEMAISTDPCLRTTKHTGGGALRSRPHVLFSVMWAHAKRGLVAETDAAFRDLGDALAADEEERAARHDADPATATELSQDTSYMMDSSAQALLVARAIAGDRVEAKKIARRIAEIGVVPAWRIMHMVEQRLPGFFGELEKDGVVLKAGAKADLGRERMEKAAEGGEGVALDERTGT